ncbi:ATP-dependent DNA helicase PIF1-like [Olea europaea var. sylvestris]|uniref:ATP-dependent DNA helicase PIF1-like n=1 Tax=Olea europaea var. sylvestris TaxID=158386 RepID=UPI000C1D092D|nr:ATP-dependent DNA helicase PIF1-like [Olea europaea var. sylvestris]
MCKLIIWDEAPMVNRHAIEAVEKMFRDVTDCDLPFGGKVIILGEDFRQVLPVVPRGKKEDIMKTSLVFSDLWPLYLQLPLVGNIRAKLDPNINHSEGLCNGTCLTCRKFNRNVILAEITVGAYHGKYVFLPRIPFVPLQNDRNSIQFERTQFPIRPYFAMTINKAQGQILNFVGLYLPEPVFCHGQLYVALSRAKTSKSLKILLKLLNADN